VRFLYFGVVFRAVKSLGVKVEPNQSVGLQSELCDKFRGDKMDFSQNKDPSESIANINWYLTYCKY
jgi:hypothetical protein